MSNPFIRERRNPFLREPSLTTEPEGPGILRRIGETGAGVAAGFGRYVGKTAQLGGKLVEGAGSVVDPNSDPRHLNFLERTGRRLQRGGEDITQNADVFDPQSLEGGLGVMAGDIGAQALETAAIGGTRMLGRGAAKALPLLEKLGLGEKMAKAAATSLKYGAASSPSVAAGSNAGESTSLALAQMLGKQEMAQTLAGNTALRIFSDLGVNTTLGMATDLGFAKLGTIRAKLKRPAPQGPITDPTRLIPSSTQIPGVAGDAVMGPGIPTGAVPQQITDPSRLIPASTQNLGVAGEQLVGPPIPLPGPFSPQSVEDVLARVRVNTQGPKGIEVVESGARSGSAQRKYMAKAAESQVEVDRAAARNRFFAEPDQDATRALEAARGVGERERAAAANGIILRSSLVPGLEGLGTEAGKRVGRATGLIGLGSAMQQFDDERIKATGEDLVVWGTLHAMYPFLKRGGIKGGTALRDLMKGSETGTRMLNLLSHDLTIDPAVRQATQVYERGIAQGKARAEELRGIVETTTNPQEQRRISDLIEQEAFEPVVGEDSPQVLALAKRIADETDRQGTAKVQEGLLSQATVDKRKGKYLTRLYPEHLIGDGTKEVGMGGRTLRIKGDARRLDLSPELRTALGEVREAGPRVEATLLKGSHDIETAKFFRTLSEIPGVVLPESVAARKAAQETRAAFFDAVAQKAPKEVRQQAFQEMRAAAKNVDAVGSQFEKLTDGYIRLPNTKGMGALRSLVVRRDAYEYIKMLPDFDSHGLYGKALSGWKRSKTVWNPGTHFGNTASNFTLGHLGGWPIPAQMAEMPAALKAWNSYDDDMRFLNESGVLQHGLPTFGDPAFSGSSRDKLRQMLPTTRPETRAGLEKAGLNPMGPIERTAKGLDLKAGRSYAKEDGVFRLGMFKHLTKNGMDREEALQVVKNTFVDYSTRSPILRAMGKSVSPFIMFPARAVPWAVDKIIEYPERWLSLMAIWGGMDQYSRYKAGNLDFNDLAEHKRDKSYILPNAIQLPLQGKEGEKSITNLTRWTPLSGLTGSPVPGSAQFKLSPNTPSALAIGGPVPDAAIRFIEGNDPFTGEPWIDPLKPDPTPLEQVGMYADQLWKFAAPTAATVHLPKVLEDVSNRDYTAALTDAFGFLGAKPTVVRAGAERRQAEWELNDLMRKAQKKLGRDLERARLNPGKQNRLVDEYEETKRRAERVYLKRVGEITTSIREETATLKRLNTGVGVQYGAKAFKVPR